MKIILSLISLAAILSMLVPASVLGQEDFRIFVTDDDAIHELDLAAIEGQNGQVNRVSGFAIEANSVVQIDQNENLQVFTSTTERIEKVKLTDHNSQLIELTKVGNEWSLQGFDDGVYLLDVIVNMPNGQTGAFETVLVILAPNAQEANPTQAINQVIKVETKTNTKEIIFKDRPKEKPKPSICYFDPDNKACEPVPSGYGRLDDDETGTCYPQKDIKRCPDGYIVHVRDQCPPPAPEPIVCPAGQELSSNGLNCAPPCDGSYQDCIYNGHFCEAGSTDHACELPLEEETNIASQLSCQPEDDYCEPGCESPTMDCIDDVNEGDDGQDELSCQPEDGYCELGCESPSMDCIDDVNVGDDREDSVPDEEVEADESSGGDEESGGEGGNGGDGETGEEGVAEQ
jgi:hypothetical protein